MALLPAIAQNEEPVLEVGGNLLSDQRVLLKKNNPWAWNENRLTVDFSKKINNTAKFYSQIWLRNIGLPKFYSFDALYNKNLVDPFNLEIRQAYFQITGFLNKNLDLTIGRQIISWGTADKINPTDNLNPYDFEDVLDFGRHRGTDAIRMDYYLNDAYSVEAVFEPFFRPANLPVGIFSNLFSQIPQLPQSMTVASFTDSIFLPQANLKQNLTAGFKFKGIIAGFDFSFSYIYGRDYLPLPSTVDITTLDARGNVDVNLNLFYPRRHIFGFDMDGNIAGIGVWAECAAFLPTKDLNMTTYIHTVNPVDFQPITIKKDSVLQQKNKPYFKYVLGADYSFANGVYANIQFVHGFINERSTSNLNDYYFLHIDKSFFYDKLKISPINGAFIVSDYKNLKDNYTWVYMPQISYKPTDNAEISVSSAIIDGKGNSIFTKLKDMDMLILKFKYSF